MGKTPDPKPQNMEKTQNREELPGGARNYDKKEPPPHTRSATQSHHAERKTPRSKR